MPMQLMNLSTQHTVELSSVPRHAGVQGNVITDKLARVGSVHEFVGP
jgi:ribonuclease HI